ncbi:hypothetical protein CERSUDRAFT_86365 [Gelatoporia subvermispora B]|uniref:Lariat debranching enzyme C-terminal domain-containing protein n=1 Tax=Ceriporiopsis subvermispora (strain B) TaxID=914234 RepID=M2R762_CERS8|nr:hypothetical protein CERSUDRAFT_86365 [Gelatoporia subvermispora B]
MRIAIEGCSHGELDKIYEQLLEQQRKDNHQIDLLLICGDFQANRNERDLECMAVPPKYRDLRDYYKYYTGEKKAPILTIVIGGNHEASNHFWELYHGGWLAPKIYFLGHAGCVQVNGLRIAGSSGIFYPSDFQQGHWERVPYQHGAMRSIYHTREFNVRRLSLLSSPDVFLSHDWPQNIVQYGNVSALLHRKPFFKEDIRTGKLGSPPMMGLLQNLKPRYWYSAHLHCRFEAEVVHDEPAQPEAGPSTKPESSGAQGRVLNPDEIAIEDEDLEQPTSICPSRPNASNPDEIVIEDEEIAQSSTTVAEQEPPAPNSEEIEVEQALVVDTVDDLPAPNPSGATAFVQETPDVAHSSRNPDEIMLDDEEEAVEAPPPPPKPKKVTSFLGLGKCVNHSNPKQYLEVTNVKLPHKKLHDGPPVLTFDPEWLAITRAFHPYMSLERHQLPYPDEATARAAVQRELEWVKKHVLGDKGSIRVGDVQKFEMTAPPPARRGRVTEPLRHWPNPQTAAFCAMLEIENKIDPKPDVAHAPGAPNVPSSLPQTTPSS